MPNFHRLPFTSISSAQSTRNWHQTVQSELARLATRRPRPPDRLVAAPAATGRRGIPIPSCRLAPLASGRLQPSMKLVNTTSSSLRDPLLSDSDAPLRRPAYPPPAAITRRRAMSSRWRGRASSSTAPSTSPPSRPSPLCPSPVTRRVSSAPCPATGRRRLGRPPKQAASTPCSCHPRRGCLDSPSSLASPASPTPRCVTRLSYLLSSRSTIGTVLLV
jgi:hypothetical protein